MNTTITNHAAVRRHSGPYIDQAVVTCARRRHIPLHDAAKAAGFATVAMFRRFMRAGDITTDQLSYAADTMHADVFRDVLIPAARTSAATR